MNRPSSVEVVFCVEVEVARNSGGGGNSSTSLARFEVGISGVFSAVGLVGIVVDGKTSDAVPGDIAGDSGWEFAGGVSGFAVS